MVGHIPCNKHYSSKKFFNIRMEVRKTYCFRHFKNTGSCNKNKCIFAKNIYIFGFLWVSKKPIYLSLGCAQTSMTECKSNNIYAQEVRIPKISLLGESIHDW